MSMGKLNLRNGLSIVMIDWNPFEASRTFWRENSNSFADLLKVKKAENHCIESAHMQRGVGLDT